MCSRSAKAEEMVKALFAAGASMNGFAIVNKRYTMSLPGRRPYAGQVKAIAEHLRSTAGGKGLRKHGRLLVAMTIDSAQAAYKEGELHKNVNGKPSDLFNWLHSKLENGGVRFAQRKFWPSYKLLGRPAALAVPRGAVLPDNARVSPLLWLAGHGRVESLAAVLTHVAPEKRTAAVNERTFGQTPLLLAARMAKFDACVNLVKWGADVLALDDDGESCLALAVKSQGSQAQVGRVPFLNRDPCMQSLEVGGEPGAGGACLSQGMDMIAVS
jgi:hypothetical protein